VCSFIAAGLTSLSLSTLIPILETLFEAGGLESLREGVRFTVGIVSRDLAGSVADSFFESRMSALVSLIVLVFVLTVVKGVFRFLNEYVVGTVSLAASRDVQDELFSGLIRQPVPFFESEGVGAVASRFTADGDAVIRGLKTFTGTMFREPLQFLFLLLLAVWISPILTLTALVIFPVIGLLIRQVGKVAKRISKRVLGHRSRLLSILQESFFGIRVVQAYRSEDRDAERFMAENQRLCQRAGKLVKTEAITSPAMEVLVVLGVGSALLLGGAMAIRGELPASRLVTLYVAVGALYEPVRKIASAIPRIQAGLAGAVRMFAYMDRVPEIRDAPGARILPPLARSIRFENVRVRYGERGDALRDVNLEIRAGSFVSVVGPSGSGKSTLAGLLPRFYDPTEGAVRLDGVDLREATLSSLRGQIALVPQEMILMNDTISANIAFARPNASPAEIRAAAERARVTEFADRQPLGLDTVVGERGSALSGGQRQRVAIARALLAEPRILVLDEATSHVDDESAGLIMDALFETREGRTTIAITHRQRALGRSDQVVFIAGGRIAAAGSHESLLAASPAYRAHLRAAGEEEE
jgi:subfamily B ATP-binding cassette protein MsbA